MPSFINLFITSLGFRRVRMPIRIPNFLYRQILKFSGFRREKKIKLNEEISVSSYSLFKDLSWSEDFISPVWQYVFSKFGIVSINEARDEVNQENLCECYEEFFVNGLSDGACVGAGLESPSGLRKYALRGKQRLELLKQHVEFQNCGQDPFLGLNLSPQLSSGQPWLQYLSGKWINPELVDHLYFYEVCKNLPIPKKDLLFIGDGSGILSNIYLNNSSVENANFVDLPHFLVRQHIANFDLKEIKQKFLTPDRVSELSPASQGRVLINQDSFPEIPEEYLNIYFNLISSGHVTDVLSYNKKDIRFGHTDFKKILAEKKVKCYFSFESLLRPGYFIEWYSSRNF